MALAVWGAMASAERLMQKQGSAPNFYGPLSFFVVAHHITWVPELRRMVLGTEAGRQTFLSLHMRLLVSMLPLSAHAVAARVILELNRFGCVLYPAGGPWRHVCVRVLAYPAVAISQ